MEPRRVTARVDAQADRLPELQQTIAMPSSDMSAGAWCEVANEAVLLAVALAARLEAAETALREITDYGDRTAVMIAEKALAAGRGDSEPPEGYIVPEGDERCGFVMDACRCMKRKGHDGLHACAHGGWRAAGRRERG